MKPSRLNPILRCFAILALVAAPLACQPPATELSQLKFPSLRDVKIPDVTEFTLSNGIKVLALEDHELPLVRGTALVRTGNLFDPPDKVGLADLTGSTMRTGGTKDKTGDQLDELLEDMAASVETEIGESSGSVTFSALKENTDQVLAVFRDVLTEPEFRQDKIDLAKTRYRSAIARRNDDADEIASREFARAVYGPDTPYGWQLEYAGLDRITRDDILGFYKRYFFPSNIIMAVYGDFNTAELKARLESLLGGWKATQPPVPPFPEVLKTPHPGVFLAKKEDVNQSFIRLGHLGGVLKDKDYPALEVMADILGGSFSSRLFKKVRTELGYAYHVSADWGAHYGHPGLFEVNAGTKSGSTIATIQVVRQEIDRIRTSEVTDQELATAKDAVLNSFVFFFDRPSKTINRLLAYEYNGYPRDFLKTYQNAISNVTKADVLRVAKQHLKPEDFTIVVAGKPEDFDKPLASLGIPVKDIDLTIPEPGKPAVVSDAASRARGRELLRKAQDAVGGAANLEAVRDYTKITKASVPTGPGGGKMNITSTAYWMAPTTLRSEQVLPFGKVVVFYDGSSGWLQSPQGEMSIPPPVARQVKQELFRALHTLLLSDRDPDRTVDAVGENAVSISDKEGNQVRLEFDPQSGLPVKETYTSPTAQGPMDVEEQFLEWNQEAGVKWPVKLTSRRGTLGTSESTVTSLKVNTGLTSGELSKKP